MLPCPQSYLQTIVVRDVVVVVAADYCFHHIEITSLHLVKVPTLSMGLGASLNGRCEVVLNKCLTHHRNVVVEVATDNDRGIRVLLDDVFGDIHNLLRSFLQLLLLPWLNVAVEEVDGMVGDL